jgi:TonB family protein
MKAIRDSILIHTFIVTAAILFIQPKVAVKVVPHHIDAIYLAPKQAYVPAIRLVHHTSTTVSKIAPTRVQKIAASRGVLHVSSSTVTAPLVSMPSLQFSAPEVTAPQLPLVNTVQDAGFGNVPRATERGVRGTVSPAGFGTGSGSNRAVGATVQGTDFGQRLAASTSTVHTQSIATEPVITYEPKPEYTKEAKRERIEGVVILLVTFGADRRVHILGVVGSLGMGLDKASVEAASVIRFDPATVDGVAVDYDTRVQYTFQLGQ